MSDVWCVGAVPPDGHFLLNSTLRSKSKMDPRIIRLDPKWNKLTESSSFNFQKADFLPVVIVIHLVTRFLRNWMDLWRPLVLRDTFLWSSISKLVSFRKLCDQWQTRPAFLSNYMIDLFWFKENDAQSWLLGHVSVPSFQRIFHVLLALFDVSIWFEFFFLQNWNMWENGNLLLFGKLEKKKTPPFLHSPPAQLK